MSNLQHTVLSRYLTLFVVALWLACSPLHAQGNSSVHLIPQSDEHNHWSIYDLQGRNILPNNNGFEDIRGSNLSGSPYLLGLKSDGWYILSAKGTELHTLKILSETTQRPEFITPNIIGYERKGSLALMNPQGVSLGSRPLSSVFHDNPHFDFILYTSFRNSAFEALYGLMNMQGKEITPPTFDGILLAELKRPDGSWLVGLQGDQSVLVNIETGKLEPYGLAIDDFIMDEKPGFVYVSEQDNQRTLGLIDQQGNVLGSVFFEKKRCGYKNANGDVFIPAQFLDCLPFVGDSALAQDAKTKKAGIINRQGQWTTSPTWVWKPYGIQPIERNQQRLANFSYLTSPYFIVGQVQPTNKTTYGLLNITTAQFEIEPIYTDLGFLARDRLIFERTGAKSQSPDVGIIDLKGRDIIPAKNGWIIDLLEDAPFFEVFDTDGRMGLVDLDGKWIVPFTTNMIAVEPEVQRILTYRNGSYSYQANQVFDFKGNSLIKFK